MITPEYAALNAELHERVQSYGTGGKRWAPAVHALMRQTGARTVLDYGCGKGTLKLSMRGAKVREYDPGVPGKDKPPKPADIVICADVMEHVEPEFTDAVLGHVCALAARAVLLVISTREGGKRLADGRPAHINVRPLEWWWPKLKALGNFRRLKTDAEGEIVAMWIKEAGP